MKPAYRLLACASLIVLACGDNGTNTTAKPSTETDPSTSSPTTTSTTDGPPTTTETTTAPTSSGTTDSTTTEGTTSEPPSECGQYLNADECSANGCEWAQIVGYTHGTQGCQGSIRDFCIPPDSAGALTSVWKDEGGDIEVLQFGFNPTFLGPEWSVCDCDSPLACLCTATQLDCPERLNDFCGLVTSEASCKNSAASGKLVCGWFTISQEGPLDGKCDDPPWQDVCLPATDIGSTSCDPISLPYADQGYCQGWTDPVYWRDNDGIIEVTSACGPDPVGWTLCVADDPSQPDECKCGCKI